LIKVTFSIWSAPLPAKFRPLFRGEFDCSRPAALRPTRPVPCHSGQVFSLFLGPWLTVLDLAGGDIDRALRPLVQVAQAL